MKKKLFLLIGMLLMLVNGIYADSLFRWKDKDGHIHYGDKPAEDAIETEQKKFGSLSESGEGDLPYSLRIAKQNFPVKLYVATNCGNPCAMAKSMLDKRGVPYAEINLATDKDIENFKKQTGGNSVPALTVGKTVLSGFEEVQWNSELDLVGYPKIAPYGLRRPSSPATEVKVEPPATTEK